MPLAVAWVGRPKKMPPSPPCLAKISAPARLRLAHAHLCFQNEHPRFLGLADGFQHGPLDFVGRKAEPFRKRPRFRHI